MAVQQLWCTGPALFYAGVGGALGAQIPVEVGTAEAKPTIFLYDEWDSVFNDLGGSKIPFDDSYQGEYAIIRGDLTRWNEPDAMAKIQARPDFTGTRGFYPFGAIGALMKTEGLAYNLWVKFPYQSKAAYSNMLPGYRFVSAFLYSPDEMPVGVTPRKIACIWVARMLFNPADGSHLLYDSNMAGLPALG